MKTLAIVGLMGASPPAMADDGWHRPSNKAEADLALALALFTTEDPAALFALLPERFANERRSPQALPKLEEAFTPALIASIRQAEKRMVNESCCGRYRKDDNCGMNASPIFCGQDWPAEPGFRTRIANSHDAVVEYGWPGISDPPERLGTYYLVKHQGRFRVDGISCRLGERFNLPEKR